MQSLDSLYSQTIPVNFRNRAMRQKCLEFIIYMFITKWDKENLQTFSCYMSFSERASRETKRTILGHNVRSSPAKMTQSAVFILTQLSHRGGGKECVSLGCLELTLNYCPRANSSGLSRFGRGSKPSRPVCYSLYKAQGNMAALNYLLHACEMLRAHVKFNEACPPQITSN